jgi:Zn-dependent protease
MGENGLLDFLIPDIDTLIYRLPAIVLALTFHEYAHARVAYAFGDPTAKDAGRLTLNPLVHLDIIGTLMLIYAHFGWAKPVPVNPYYLRGNRKQKMMWVSVAGPLSNLVQALIVAVIFSLLWHFVPTVLNNWWLPNFLFYIIVINIVLAVFNLLPIPPLDGSKILAGLLPNKYTNIIYQLERYGFIVLIVLMFLGVFGKIISPIVDMLIKSLFQLVGLGSLL